MNLVDLPLGLHDAIPAEVYHQRVLGVVNTGALKILNAQTPAHYKAWVEGEQEFDTPALALGRAFHCAVLEPYVFLDSYAIAPRVDRRTKEGKAAYEAFLAGGKEAITEEDFLRIDGMRISLVCHPIAGPLLSGGKSEVTAIYDGPFGLKCKARFDYWREDLNLIVDLKSSDDASEKTFAKSVANFAYHVQAAHYTDAINRIRKKGVDFAFVVVEKKPPYAVAVYMLDNESFERGMELRHRAMALLNDCLKNDTWPSYANEVKTLSLPGWAYTD